MPKLRSLLLTAAGLLVALTTWRPRKPTIRTSRSG